jgi:hypothetical protein
MSPRGVSRNKAGSFRIKTKEFKKKRERDLVKRRT